MIIRDVSINYNNPESVSILANRARRFIFIVLLLLLLHLPIHIVILLFCCIWCTDLSVSIGGTKEIWKTCAIFSTQSYSVKNILNNKI